MKALDLDVQMVLTGRANDTSLPWPSPQERVPQGAFPADAKVVECSGGGAAGRPHSLPSLDPIKRGSRASWDHLPRSVLRKEGPTRPEYMPGGHLDITNARWEQLEGLTTKAYGGVWVDDPTG